VFTERYGLGLQINPTELRVMAQAAIGRLHKAETTFDPRPVLVIFMVYEVALLQFPLPGHRFFPCQYHSIDNSY